VIPDQKLIGSLSFSRISGNGISRRDLFDRCPIIQIPDLTKFVSVIVIRTADRRFLAEPLDPV
jgi:hypothetical protein